MKTPNRRKETYRQKEAQDLFFENKLYFKNVIQIGHYNENKEFLEGTGSISSSN
jgi:hypothetical protein